MHQLDRVRGQAVRRLEDFPTQHDPVQAARADSGVGLAVAQQTDCVVEIERFALQRGQIV